MAKKINRSNWPKQKQLEQQLCTCSTLFCTFLCRCCCNVKLPSYTFYGENVECARKKFAACVLVRLFFFVFHYRSFSPCLPLSFLIFSPPLYNFHLFLPTKFVSSVFLSLAVALCRSFSSWPSLACRLLSRCLCLSLSLWPYSEFVNMTI